MPALTQREKDAQSLCAGLMAARAACWQQQGGKDTELCLKEELLEKRCIARVVCKREADAFYGSDPRHLAACSLWAEAFAFKDAEHEKGRAEVQASPARRKLCQSITQDVSSCLAGSAARLYH
jgi:hypothetical protein